MGRKAKEKVIGCHAGNLLKSLRARAGLSVRDVAASTGYSAQAIHVAEVRTRDASTNVIVAFARACNATQDEFDRLPALVALDKGWLEVPKGATEAMVSKAMGVMRG